MRREFVVAQPGRGCGGGCRVRGLRKLCRAGGGSSGCLSGRRCSALLVTLLALRCLPSAEWVSCGGIEACHTPPPPSAACSAPCWAKQLDALVNNLNCSSIYTHTHTRSIHTDTLNANQAEHTWKSLQVLSLSLSDCVCAIWMCVCVCAVCICVYVCVLCASVFVCQCVSSSVCWLGIAFNQYFVWQPQQQQQQQQHFN